MEAGRCFPKWNHDQFTLLSSSAPSTQSYFPLRQQGRSKLRQFTNGRRLYSVMNYKNSSFHFCCLILSPPPPLALPRSTLLLPKFLDNEIASHIVSDSWIASKSTAKAWGIKSRYFPTVFKDSVVKSKLRLKIKMEKEVGVWFLKGYSVPTIKQKRRYEELPENCLAYLSWRTAATCLSSLMHPTVSYHSLSVTLGKEERDVHRCI